ncbi:MAG: hypothetical protein KIT23_08415 [Sphingopyxis sp.]|nr:hypothetical protein [Sphingopyxis sp.]
MNLLRFISSDSLRQTLPKSGHISGEHVNLKGLSREFDRLSEADHAYIDDGIALLGIAKDARQMFAKADHAGKRNILHHLLSNCSYKDGEVSATFRKPFDIIVESFPQPQARDSASSANIGKSEKWLPG